MCNDRTIHGSDMFGSHIRYAKILIAGYLGTYTRAPPRAGGRYGRSTHNVTAERNIKH